MRAPINPMARVTVSSHFQKNHSNYGVSSPEFSLPIHSLKALNVKAETLSLEGADQKHKSLVSQ